MSEGQGPWRRFGERSIYESPSLRLEQVDFELSGGARHWHDVVRMPRTSAMVVLDDLDRVLLVQRHRLVPDRWGFEIPGGFADEDEGLAEAACRALEEETGYRTGKVEHLLTFRPTAGTVDAEQTVFVGHDAERIGEISISQEFRRPTWVPLASVPALIASKEIWNAETMVPLLWLLSHEV